MENLETIKLNNVEYVRKDQLNQPIETMNKIKGIVAILKRDCENQLNALNTRKDVSWDCYDKNNWQAMLDLLKEIENYNSNRPTIEDINRIQELVEYRKIGDKLTFLEHQALSSLENKLGDMLGEL